MNVEVIKLRKVFAKTVAVNSISFSFSSGQIIGFVGSNGAGKTTTIKIMSTLMEPTSGDVLFDGISVVDHPEKIRHFVGYMPDSLPTHSDMSVHEYLDFFARAYGLKGKKRNNVLEEIKEFTNLLDIQEKFLNALSKGMKQRVSLARALIHDPQILIMDEPAAGLDPRARMELRELMTLLAEQGKSILLSSHILTELGEICTDVVIIEKGQLLKTGSLDTLASEEIKKTIAIRALGDPVDLYKKILLLPDMETAQLNGQFVEIELIANDDNVFAHFLKNLILNDIQIIEFKHQNQKLEEIFMDVTKGHIQ